MKSFALLIYSEAIETNTDSLSAANTSTPSCDAFSFPDAIL